MDPSSLVASSHAVERYRERSGTPTESYQTIVEKLKDLVRRCPRVEGERNTSYIRATGNGHDPIWVVVQGRVIRTVLSHRQYLRNVEVGRAL